MKNIKPTQNKEQSEKKAGVRLPLGFKITLIALLMALAAKGISAAEILNAKVLEYFEQTIGRSNFGFVGVDSTRDGLVDTFIVIEGMQLPIYKRIANLIQQAGVVSYDDSKKINDRDLGAYSLGCTELLEIGGKSVLELFPGQRAEFPREFARQERLRAQAPARPASPPPAPQQSAEERRIADLEAELQRLRQGR